MFGFEINKLLPMPSGRLLLAASAVTTLAKIMKLFSGAIDMCKDQEFRQLLMAWARVSRLTNMGCERLLAQIKSSSANAGPGAPDVERVCAAGHLAQWLTQHPSANGEDSRVVSRKQILETGAPLLRRAKAKAKLPRRKHRPAGSFTVFYNMRRGNRVKRGEVLSKSEAKAEQGASVEE